MRLETKVRIGIAALEAKLLLGKANPYRTIKGEDLIIEINRRSK